MKNFTCCECDAKAIGEFMPRGWRYYTKKNKTNTEFLVRCGQCDQKNPQTDDMPSHMLNLLLSMKEDMFSNVTRKY